MFGTIVFGMLCAINEASVHCASVTLSPDCLYTLFIPELDYDVSNVDLLRNDKNNQISKFG